MFNLPAVTSLESTAVKGIPMVFSNPANVTTSVDRFLGTNGGFVVDILQGEPQVIITGPEFYAFFPIKIESIDYTIIITGDLRDIQKPGIGGRVHPFSSARSGKYKPGELITGDIKIDTMEFKLKDRNGRILKTDGKFWEQLRNRIPAYHPLSTNQ